MKKLLLLLLCVPLIGLGQVPSPVMELCGTEALQENYSKKEIFDLRICAKLETEVKGIRTKVISFDITALSVEGDVEKVNRTTSFSSKAVRSLIQKTEKGTVIVIDNIIWKMNEESMKYSGRISFKIK
jgi:hypothetical protein